MAQMQQQQQSLEAEKQEEQARISEEQRQEAIHMVQAQQQQQQQPQNSPTEDDDEDLYGNDARGEASQQAFIAARKMELAKSESVVANEAKPEATQTTEQNNEADSVINEDGQNTQVESAVHQQPTREASEHRKQASAPRATIDLSQSRWSTPEEPLSAAVPDHRNNASFVQAAAQKSEADSRMDVEVLDAQPNPDVQQQPVTEATNNMQQASTSSAVIGRPPPTPTTGVLRRLRKTQQNNGGNGKNGKRNRDRPRPVVEPPKPVVEPPSPVAEAPKPPTPPRARDMFTASIKGHDIEWLTLHDTTEALDLNWTYQDINPHGNHHPLSTSKSDEANLVLVKTWLEQNNDCVDDLRRRLNAPEFADEDETEQYTLLFGQNGVQTKIKQMSDRYEQLRDHACIQRGSTQVFDWQDYVISPDEIRTNGLKTLAGKDLSFLSDMRNALRPASENNDDISPDKPDYTLVFEAYAIALSVSRSMRHITAPAQIAVPTSGPLAGDDSDLADCDD